jgi:hypothetical protein
MSSAATQHFMPPTRDALRRAPSLRTAVALAAAALLAPGVGRAQSAATPALAQHFVPVTAYAAAEQTTMWPAPGAPVTAAAIECDRGFVGGGRGVCRSIPLARVTAATENNARTARCFALHAVTPSGALLRRIGQTDWSAANADPHAPRLLLTRDISREREPIHGRCLGHGLDACMGPREVVVWRVVRQVLDEVHLVGSGPPASAEPFQPLRTSLVWLGPWPEPTADHPANEAPLLAQAQTRDADPAVRFAAWIDLVVARLMRNDVPQATIALNQAAAFAPALTGAAWSAPDATHTYTPTDLDAIAAGPGSIGERYNLLMGVLGLIRASGGSADLLNHGERVRATLVTRLPRTPAIEIFRSHSAQEHVPQLLGQLTLAVHWRWADPCGAAPAPH